MLSTPDTELHNEVICTSQEVRQQSLEALLRAARPHGLHVPLFQRRYCWAAEQWAKLEADVQGAASSGATLFIGRMLTFVGPNDPRTLVCDGQQRLVTLSLLLAAARDVALSAEVDLPELAAQIDDLLFLDGAGARARPVLVPTHDDRAPYLAALAWPAPPATDGGGSLGAAKRHLVERTRASLALHHAAPAPGAPAADAAACREAWRARLRQLCACALGKVELVVFRLDEGEEVHRVFEQHAGREKALKAVWNFAMPGMHVAACDLIRNLLMSYVRDEAEQARLHEAYWLEVERRATGGSGTPFDLESFFMAFLHAVGFSVGSRPELYAGFRDWLAKGALAEARLDDPAAVCAAVERALQLMLAEADKWEARVHRAQPPTAAV